MAEYFIEIVKLSGWFSSPFRLNDLYSFSGEFPSLQQYNLGIGKGEGKVEGVGVKGMGSE